MFNDSTPYFSVMHDFTVYLTPWPKDTPLPSESELKFMLPTGLLLISDVKALEADCLMQLRHFDDEAKSIVDYLKLQSRKIDLVLQHVIEQEQHEGEKHRGLSFGGSGIRIIGDTQLEVGSQYKITLHIKEELIALLCFVRVSASQPADGDENRDKAQYIADLEFTQILDTDVEQLVKASLSVQQKHLKQRKLAKRTP
ncbi:hypothetical protein [uncultured Shewanella sp.]|uniref:hypothetical protein n=1 Tax=Shewanella atlantica TaxID=271099 RepID=UPI002618E7A6|nr:hypothetical protein [uncultured Shewanella sp.]